MKFSDLLPSKVVYIETEPNLSSEEISIQQDYRDVISNIEISLRSQPGLTDLHAVQEYLTELRVDHFELLRRWSDIQKRFIIHQAAFIRTSDDNFYKRLKNSSTLIENAAMSTFPYSEEYYMIKDLLKLLQQVSPEFNTLVSALKLEKV
jgi:hypothetical protein